MIAHAANPYNSSFPEDPSQKPLGYLLVSEILSLKDSVTEEMS